jgi:Prophage CP4-57 regulatory protein (AlpA)
MTNQPPRGPLIRRLQFTDHGIPTKENKTINDWIAKHGFPKPYRLGERTVVWSLPEILDWMASRRQSDQAA